jgi:hypothetical protein
VNIVYKMTAMLLLPSSLYFAASSPAPIFLSYFFYNY